MQYNKVALRHPRDSDAQGLNVCCVVKKYIQARAAGARQRWCQQIQCILKDW
jgi:hypothetical protein